MFMGEYNHTIDAKGRLIIPSKFRELLGEEFVLTKGQAGENSCTADVTGIRWSGKRRCAHRKPQQN